MPRVLTDLPDRRARERDARELLLIEEADAWFEYLATTQEQRGARYESMEPWAWGRLRARLKAVKTRLERLAA